MSLYPTRDNQFRDASQRRLKEDPRKHVYGNHSDSLLIEHSFPELTSKAATTNSVNVTPYNSRSITPNCWQPINITHYRIIKKIGSGTYGSVFHAQSPNGRDVAIKQLCPMQNDKHLQDGFHITAIREIKILKSLNHPNVISLHDVICCKENIMSDRHETTKKSLKKGIDLDRMATYMIFEYMHHDLSGLLHNDSVSFDIRHIKYFLCQILNALEYCHDTAMILHRDIKSSNLLVDDRGVVKIADFGLSRQFIPDLKAKNKRIAARHESVNTSAVQHPRHYTNRVVTLWYRAPELLLSDVHYSPAVDLWSVGCVFAELLFNKPIFTGKNEIEQWLQIIEVCGWNMNKETSWISTLRDKDGLIAKIKKKSKLFPRTLKQKFSKFLVKTPPNKNKNHNEKYLDESGFELLDSLLTINPNKRCIARQALQSDWFRCEPFAEAPDCLGSIQPSHDYEQRQQRKNGNYRNGNANSQRRYQYSYNQYAPRTRERSRSRSRSRDRMDRDKSTLSRSENGKGNSVPLPPPIQRLPSIHHTNHINHNNAHPIKQVVTLCAPKLISNNNVVTHGHMHSGGAVGGGYKNGYNPAQPTTFYSRFKKPDELKGRSRF